MTDDDATHFVVLSSAIKNTPCTRLNSIFISVMIHALIGYIQQWYQQMNTGTQRLVLYIQ